MLAIGNTQKSFNFIMITIMKWSKFCNNNNDNSNTAQIQ